MDGNASLFFHTDLCACLGTSIAPLPIGVRRDVAFNSDDRLTTVTVAAHSGVLVCEDA